MFYTPTSDTRMKEDNVFLTGLDLVTVMGDDDCKPYPILIIFPLKSEHVCQVDKISMIS